MVILVLVRSLAVSGNLCTAVIYCWEINDFLLDVLYEVSQPHSVFQEVRKLVV